MKLSDHTQGKSVKELRTIDSGFQNLGTTDDELSEIADRKITMMDNELSQAKTLYKSPKSVRKGLSLRELFPRRNPLKSVSGDTTHPIRVLVSVRPGSWQRVDESFEHFDHAFELVEDFERQGYRVKILDCTNV